MVATWSRFIESLISKPLKNADVFCAVLCAQTYDVMHGSAVPNKVIKVGANFILVFAVTLKTTSLPKL